MVIHGKMKCHLFSGWIVAQIAENVQHHCNVSFPLIYFCSEFFMAAFDAKLEKTAAIVLSKFGIPAQPVGFEVSVSRDKARKKWYNDGKQMLRLY